MLRAKTMECVSLMGNAVGRVGLFTVSILFPFFSFSLFFPLIQLSNLYYLYFFKKKCHVFIGCFLLCLFVFYYYYKYWH